MQTIYWFYSCFSGYKMKGTLFILLLSILLGGDGKTEVNSKLKSIQFEVNETQHEVFYLEDEMGLPAYFYTNVKQLPCTDSVCFIMRLRIYWDASGNYLFYNLDANEELTKLSHISFTNEEYHQLHGILNDPNSGMQYITEKDLVTRTFINKPDGVDAITDATNTAFDFEYIDSAIKTSFSLWNISNHDLRNHIKDFALDTWTKDQERLRFDFSNQHGENRFWNEYQKMTVREQLTTLNELEENAHRVTENIIKKLTKELDQANIILFTAIINVIEAKGYFNKKIEKELKSHLQSNDKLRSQLIFNLFQQSNKGDLIEQKELHFRTKFP